MDSVLHIVSGYVLHGLKSILSRTFEAMRFPIRLLKVLSTYSEYANCLAQLIFKVRLYLSWDIYSKTLTINLKSLTRSRTPFLLSLGICSGPHPLLAAMCKTSTCHIVRGEVTIVVL